MISTQPLLVATTCLLLIFPDKGTGEDIRALDDIPYKEGEVSEYEKERCKLDLYLPADPDGCATIVWFHGGGLQGGDKAGDIEVAFAKHFAGQGIAVASVNYRLHPRVEYPAYIEDAAAAVAFIRKSIGKHGGSPERVFVSGHSAGGYLTAMIGTDASLLEKHGLTHRSIAGLMPVAGQMVTHSTVRKERGIPRSQPVIDQAAPAFHVGKDAPPFICFVGDNDLPARAEENRYFVAAMKAAGHKDVTYMEVEGRDHGTVASMIGSAEDAVAEAIVEFISRLEKR